MMADYNVMAVKTDQVDPYYRHNFDIGSYFDNFKQVKFGSKPEFVGVSKKNQDGSSNLGYMNLKKDH